MVSGSKGTANIVPLENPTTMTWSDLSIATHPYTHLKEDVQISDVPPDCRYDTMACDFYDYVMGNKENPFTYRHDYTVQKVIMEMIKDLDTPKILVINKIDTMSPEEYKQIFDEYDELNVFDGIFGTSALEGINVNDLLAKIETYLEEGPMFFPEDMVTDSPIKQRISEIVREKLLWALDKEVPHGIAIEVTGMEEEKIKVINHRIEDLEKYHR